ncbi:MAG: cation:proton antiporter [Cellvibrionaceae bacterium]
MHGEIGNFLTQMLIVLGGATVLSVIFYRLRLPSILAFLLVGFLCGPTGFKIIVNPEELHQLAELGLTFLLFVLGLEFSIPKLMALRHTVFRLGGAQVLVCSAVFFAAFYWWGLPWETSLIVSGGLALSSTAIVSRELIQRGQLHYRHGQIAIGVLLFQDLVAIALLIAVPLLAGTEEMASIKDIGLSLGKSAGLLVCFYLVARYVLPFLLSEVARARSDELLVLSALVIVLVASAMTSSIGLSMELGAFLAGMMLGDSRFRHQLETDVRPLRDILLGLFFISVGMLVDAAMLQEYWKRILICGLLLLAFKAAIIASVAKLLGESWRAALPAGLVLAQGGEFLFALLSLAARDNLVEPDVASFLVAVTIVSMGLTPVLIRYAEVWTDFIINKVSLQKIDDEIIESTLDAESKQGHVIILGFGRVAQTIARFLKQANIEYIALETDTVRIAEAVPAGEPVFYGDTSRRDILKSAGIEKSSLMVISFDDAAQASHIAKVAKEINPNLKILARTRDDTHLDELVAAGATEVVPETLEASLTLVSHALLLLGLPSRKIHTLIDQSRRDRYRILHGFYHGERTGLINEHADVLHAVRLTKEAWANGKKIAYLTFPGIKDPVSGIKRGDLTIDGEEIEKTVFEANDIVLLQGTLDQVDMCEMYLLTGRR